MEGAKIRLVQTSRQDIDKAAKEAGQLLFATYDESINAVPAPASSGGRGGSPVEKTIRQGDIYLDLSGGSNGVRVNIANDVDKARSLHAGRTLSSDMDGTWNISQLEGVHELYDGLTIAVHLSTGSASDFNTLNVNNLGPELIWVRPGQPLDDRFPANSDIILTYRTYGIGTFVVPSTRSGGIPANTAVTRGWMVVTQPNINIVEALGSAAVGSNKQPIYWDGKKFALMTAVGSATKPVYFNSTGTITQCSTYAGGTLVNLNGASADSAGAKISIYAPITAGVEGDVLISKGPGKAPEWADKLDVYHGGTGRDKELTANRLVWAESAALMSCTASIYTNGTDALAINKTSITSGFKFEVVNDSRFQGNAIFEPAGASNNSGLKIFQYATNGVALQGYYNGLRPTAALTEANKPNSNLLLQPYGGQVYINHAVNSAYGSTYSLVVGGASIFGGNIVPKTSNTYWIGYGDLLWKGRFSELFVETKLTTQQVAISGQQATEHTTDGALIVNGGVNIAMQLRVAQDAILYINKDSERSLIFGSGAKSASSGGASLVTAKSWRIAYKNSGDMLSIEGVKTAGTWVQLLSFDLNQQSTFYGNVIPVNTNLNFGSTTNYWSAAYIERLYTNILSPRTSNTIVMEKTASFTIQSTSSTVQNVLTIKTDTSGGVVLEPYADLKGVLGTLDKRWNCAYIDYFVPDYSLTKTSTTITTAWTTIATGPFNFSGNTTALSSGTYIVQVVTGSIYWSGVMSLYNKTDGGANYTEIPLHGNGPALGYQIYLRVNNNATIQISASQQVTATINLRLKRIM